MTTISDRLKFDPNKELSPEELGQFVTNFLSFTNQIKQAAETLEDMKNKIIQELSSQGINIPGLNP